MYVTTALVIIVRCSICMSLYLVNLARHTVQFITGCLLVCQHFNIVFVETDVELGLFNVESNVELLSFIDVAHCASSSSS